MQHSVEIHTDGSSRPQTTKCAGWGFVAIMVNPETLERMEIRRYGHLPAPSTNNIGELMGAIKALELFRGQNYKIKLCTDSQYVVKGIQEYIHNWKRNNWETTAWKSTKKTPVKNAELWKRLDAAREGQDVVWEWERGHSGNEWNEIADELANWGSDRIGYDHPSYRKMIMDD